MTAEAKKAKILAAVASQGYFTADLYYTEGRELVKAGLVKIDTRYTVGGNKRWVYVAA